MRPGTPRRPAQPSPALSAAMAGAVDLAAIAARNEAAARAADAPAPALGQYVVDVTEASFQAEVLDRSFQLPVIIELRSPRSAASQTLGPLLEKLAIESAGTWVLASVDVDANPRIAQALQVQAVPTVFAVIGGQLVPGFEGGLPEEQLRGFVEAVEQAGRDAGLTAVPPIDDGPPTETDDVGEPEDPRFVAAEDALQDGDYDLATQRYEAILAAEPNNSQATLALLQVALLSRIETLDESTTNRADQAPDDVDAQFGAADLAMAGGDVEGAFARLIATLSRTTGDDRDRVRTRLLEYFDLLGPDDPRVAPARREMARVLF